MGWWNDNNARIGSGGELSLGGQGFDDAQGNATYPYAKNDVWINVNAADLIGDTLPALTYATGDIPKRTLVNATHKVIIPFNAPQRSFVAATGRTQNPHGVMVKSVALAYRVNTSDLTSITMALRNYRLVAAAALPTVVAPAGTVAGGTLTQAANVYLLTFTVTTPAFVVVQDTVIDAMATIVVPTNTCDLLGASWRVAYAMY